jgi:hypothetical protein
MSQHGLLTCSNGFCTTISLCGGVDGASSVRTLTTDVRLDTSGDAMAIRHEDTSSSFRMDLRREPNRLSGTAVGEFRYGALQVRIGSGESAATVTGTRQQAVVSGHIDGQVSIGGYSCSNNGHTWTLVPR